MVSLLEQLGTLGYFLIQLLDIFGGSLGILPLLTHLFKFHMTQTILLLGFQTRGDHLLLVSLRLFNCPLVLLARLTLLSSECFERLYALDLQLVGQSLTIAGLLFHLHSHAVERRRQCRTAVRVSAFLVLLDQCIQLCRLAQLL